MNNSKYLLGVCTFVCLSSLVWSYNILVVHPVYAGSHILVLRRILEQLVNQGHQIKVIRWKESSNIPVMNSPNVSETILGVNNSAGLIPFMSQEEKAEFVFPSRLMWQNGLEPSVLFAGGMQTAAASCRTLFTEEHLLHELRNTTFHLAIVDLLYNECGLALANHLNTPVIAYWGIGFMSGEAQYTTAFNPSSTFPHVFISTSEHMSFPQRLMNFLGALGSHFTMQMQFYLTDPYIQRYLPGTPHSSDLLANISGMLINSHPAFGYPMQLPPSFLQIGGFHVRQPKPLPKDLEHFLDNAEDGVILFSFGKNFEPSSLPSSVMDSLFKAFSKIKQRVIVKSSASPRKLPKNIKVLPNIPQADILAHPKTILFITHCGMHGVMEAIYYGVKMIGVPIFFDQGNVAERLAELGVALILQKNAITESEIVSAIYTVINEKKYDENMKRLWEIYHLSYEEPLERALWLIHHVIKTNGADHLKLKSKELNFIQYFSIDVLTFLCLFSFLLCYAIRLFYRWMKRRVVEREPKTKFD